MSGADGPAPGAVGGRPAAADRLACWLAAIGPLGFFPVAPATFASFCLAALYLLAPGGRPLWADGLVVVLVTAVGIWAAGRGERRWGHDARHIVIDEAAGMAVTLWAMPAGWTVAALGFVYFRIFDIAKPFPGRRAEALPGGFGVMTDDLVAGIYAHLTLRVTLLLL
ncbi:MAG: phosphatidylglycerophosphatase A, partial [Candidatus Eiseniibacteriota bacterium]